MKTPREILLQRHQLIKPELDSVREQAMKMLDHSAKIPPGGLLFKLWQELILPCRPVWGGLAVAWIALLFFHIYQEQKHQPVEIAHTQIAAPVMFLALREQEEILNELLGPANPAPSADKIPPVAPLPHSERHRNFSIG